MVTYAPNICKDYALNISNKDCRTVLCLTITFLRKRHSAHWRDAHLLERIRIHRHSSRIFYTPSNVWTIIYELNNYSQSNPLILPWYFPVRHGNLPWHIKSTMVKMTPNFNFPILFTLSVRVAQSSVIEDF